MKQNVFTYVGGALLFAIAIGFTGCDSEKVGAQNEDEQQVKESTHVLIHSHAKPAESRLTHLSWDADVDFDTKQIQAKATYILENAHDADRFILDVRNLNIESVWVDGDITDKWWLGKNEDQFGQGLEIEIKPSTKQVSIAYTTPPEAQALQWLNPQQTAGKVHPFLFTQSQAILARTWIPIQDSPGIRFTYDAHVSVPSGLMAVMSASNPIKIDSTGEYDFEMNQPVPSYLLALAVGDIRFQSIGAQTGVYAEPSVIEAAAYEFEDMQKMLASAETIYGDYAWERYDVLVLPPSFPFGGMENPRLTFATPTILAGDKSLTALIAHELAHSWSGNLVTNRTWNDFWLNEGFTVYFERRIMEAVYGRPYAQMLQVLGRQDLLKTLDELGEDNPDTHLKLDLDNRDPDDGMTDIAYEKGNAFLMMLEEAVGRAAFDVFLNKHFTEHAFKTTNTEDFLKQLKQDLLDGDDQRYAALKIDEWVYGAGLPDNAVKVSSDAFSRVEKALHGWMINDDLSAINPEGWTTHHWLHFLRNIPDTISLAQMRQLDSAFGFTEIGNSELAAEWYVLSLNRGYAYANQAIETFLVRVGRRKFLTPIYKAMLNADQNNERARAIYAKARNNYHSVSVSTLDELLNWDEYETES